MKWKLVNNNKPVPKVWQEIADEWFTAVRKTLVVVCNKTPRQAAAIVREYQKRCLRDGPRLEILMFHQEPLHCAWTLAGNPHMPGPSEEDYQVYLTLVKEVDLPKDS
jgi:hypothetical protein